MSLISEGKLLTWIWLCFVETKTVIIIRQWYECLNNRWFFSHLSNHERNRHVLPVLLISRSIKCGWVLDWDARRSYMEMVDQIRLCSSWAHSSQDLAQDRGKWKEKEEAFSQKKDWEITHLNHGVNQPVWIDCAVIKNQLCIYIMYVYYLACSIL